MVNNRKSLVITSLNRDLEQFFLGITNKKTEDLMIINSFGAEITQGFSSIMRSIILAIYVEKIEEIFIIGEKNSKEYPINEEMVFDLLEKEGIPSDIISTLDYIKAAGSDLGTWLRGSQDIESTIRKNKDLIEKHPLTPKSIQIHGYIVDMNSLEYEGIS
ncbi:MAG: hypothetical protein ACQEUT_20145 [Bacillota bacterium]